MPAGRVFIDTNVLVHWVYHGQDARKHEVAIGCVEALAEPGAGPLGAVSPQVVGEFLQVCGRHLRHEVTRDLAREAAETICAAFTMIPLDAATTREALRARERYRLDYFDAQIWAAARVSGCDVILTEDTHGEQIEGVRYLDPFARGFEAASLLR